MRARIEDLVGEPLAGVHFVQSYVEFYFDGPIVRSLAYPILHGAGHVPQFPAPGSRDALCSLIGHTLIAVDVQDGEAIRLRFDNRVEVAIPIGQDPELAESAHYVPASNYPITVW